MRKRVIGIIAAILTISFWLSWTDVASSEEDVAEVETAPVKVGKISQKLSLMGNIEANKKVSVFAKIPGEVVKLKVDMGDRVKKDDVLAVIEHKTLELNVRQAKAALDKVPT